MADVNIKIQLEAAKAQRDLARLTAQTEKFNAQAEKAKLAAKRAEQGVSQVGDAARRTRNAFSIANISLASFIGNLTSRAVSSGVSAVINGFREVINRGREFEAALIGVGKTTGITGNDLQRLGSSLEDIGKRIPVSTQRLLELATVAGQLGLNSSQEIEKFTETVAKLELATDIAGEEGAQSIAKILDITGELGDDGPANIEKFGSVITQLGNNFAATESQIVKVANEVAKGTAAFNLSSEDVLGLATAFKVTGSEAEISGSVIQKVFTEIGKAAENGGDDLKKFADAAGVTSEQFEELFRRDPSEAFLKLAKGLGESGKSGAELAVTLEQLGFADRRVARSLGPLITRYEILEDALNAARKESVELNALTEETRRAQNSLNSDLTKLSNSFDRLANRIFARVSPAFRELIRETTSFIDTVSESFETPSLENISVLILEISKNTVGLLSTNAAFRASIDLLSKSIQGLNENFTQHIANVNELEKGYEQLDEDSKNYLNTLTGVVGATEEIAGPLSNQNRLIKETRDSYVSLDGTIEEYTEKAVQSSQFVLAFERDKLKELKKFFTEEERARLESTFKQLSSEKERQEFLNTFAREGARRQQQEFLRTIGLDKATLEAKRKQQRELQQLREAQEQFEAEQDEKRRQRLEQLRQREQEADQAELQNKLLKQEGDIVFQDEEFARLTQHLDRVTQAQFAAREANLQDEITKQELLAEARQKANENEIRQREAATTRIAQLEQQKGRLTLGFAEAAGSAILQATGANQATIFAFNKAFAAADIVVRGLQAEALALAQLGPIAGAPVAAAIKANTGIQLATLAATTIGQVAAGSFEQGGIVPGSSFTGDRLSANVNSGEMILNRQQQSNLFALANGQGNAGGQQAPINLTTKVVLSDDTVIGEATSRWVANGGVLGEVQ